jgi:hypothetical protein
VIPAGGFLGSDEVVVVSRIEGDFGNGKVDVVKVTVEASK